MHSSSNALLGFDQARVKLSFAMKSSRKTPLFHFIRSILSGKLITALVTLLCIFFLLQQFFRAGYAVEDESEPEETQKTGAAVDHTGIFDNATVEQDDPRLIQHLREKRLKPPSPVRNIDRPYETSEWGAELLKIFKEKKNGFYIECGANDGEYLSNTYKMDKAYNWSGLLIEANPFLIKDLHAKGRNAWIADACISIKPYAQKVEFIHRVGKQSWFKGNGIIKPSGRKDNPTLSPKTHNLRDYVSAGIVECFPLYSFLAAINVTTVDYFSLDVEGAEYKILKNIPFEKLAIKVISVEFDVIPEGKAKLLELLTGKGYEVLIETYRELFMVHTKFKHEFE